MAKRKTNKKSKSVNLNIDDINQLAKGFSASTTAIKSDKYFVNILNKAKSSGDLALIASTYFDWAMNYSNQNDGPNMLETVVQARKSLGDYLDSYFMETLANYLMRNYREGIKLCRSIFGQARRDRPGSKKIPAPDI